MKGEPIGATEYTQQTWVVTGEAITVPKFPGYKANRHTADYINQSERDTMERNLQQLIDQGSVPNPSSRWGEPEKVEHAERGTVFSILAVRPGTDQKFGGYWDVDIIVGDEKTALQLSAHEKRDEFMTALADELNNGPIHGCRLISKGGSKGSPFLIIGPAGQ